MDHEVPADATTLIYLAKADAFADLVPGVGGLLVPQGVWFEAVEEGERIGAPEVPRIRRAERLGLVRQTALSPAEQRVADQLRQQGLGRGECEVLAMGVRTGAVVIDEGRGARVAEVRGLRVHATLELVVRARRAGRIDNLRAREVARDLAVAMNATAAVLAAIERMLDQ